MKTIAAQPFDFTFDPAHTALIVIDMQRDFIEPGGFGATLGNDVSLLSAIVPTVGRLIEALRMAGLTVIHTRDCHKPDLSDCPPAKRLRGKPSMRIGDILAERRITHLVFAGVTTEVCVQTTMREANDRGFECLLAEDATESYFPEFKKAALDMIRAQGAIVGWTATVDQIAGALR